MASKMSKKLLLMSKDTTQEIEVDGYPDFMIEEIREEQPEKVTEDGKVKFEIRPLSDGELAEAKEPVLKGLDVKQSMLKNVNTRKIKQMKDQGASDEEIAEVLEKQLGDSDIEVDVGQLQINSKESVYKLCAMGLSTNKEKWTPNEVKQLPDGVPDKIANKIKDISTFQTASEDEEKN